MQPGDLAAPADARSGAQGGTRSGTMPHVLTVADVLAEVLDTAARSRVGAREPALLPAPPPPAPPPPAPPLPLGPVPLARLLERDGTGFVVGAYADLLGRDPDRDALAHYRDELVSGRLPKVAILGVLRHSPEGRRRGRPVPGLRRRVLLQRAYGVPVFGRVLRTAAAVVALPRLMRDLQRLEQQSLQDRERVERLERALASAGGASGR